MSAWRCPGDGVEWWPGAGGRKLFICCGWSGNVGTQFDHWSSQSSGVCSESVYEGKCVRFHISAFVSMFSVLLDYKCRTLIRVRASDPCSTVSLWAVHTKNELRSMGMMDDCYTDARRLDLALKAFEALILKYQHHCYQTFTGSKIIRLYLHLETRFTIIS